MPGETAGDVSGWTIDTAMAYWNRRFLDLTTKLDERDSAQKTAMAAALAAQQSAVAAAMASAKEAVSKAEDANNSKFAAANEFRGQLNDQAGTFVTKPEFNALLDRIGRIEKRLDTSSGMEQGQRTQVDDARAHSGNVGLWVGVSAAAIFSFLSLAMTIVINVVNVVK